MTDQNNKIETAMAALAESVGSIVDEVSDGQAEALAETFSQFQDHMTKRVATHASSGPAIEFDVGDSRYTFPNKRALAVWLACQERIAKQEESLTKEQLESERTAKLRAVVKSHGITALAKGIIADGASGIDEAELVQFATEDAQRAYPDLSPAQAFEKVYMADANLREALALCKTASAAPYFDLQPVFVGGDAALDVNDPSEAIAQLTRIGRQKWPTASEAQQFANAFDDPANAELARRAYRRPSATTVFPMPR